MVDPASLYGFAHQFYWDFRRLNEGKQRWTLDQAKADQLDEELQNLDVPSEAAEEAEREICEGRLSPSKRRERQRELEEQLREVMWLGPIVAREESMKWVKIKGEPEVVQELLDPRSSPERIRAVCREAVMTERVKVEHGVFKEVEIPAWPIQVGGSFPTYLSQFAEQYVAALRDPRYPKCDVSRRPSTQLKQFWFLSRALAGAVFGVATRTAINLVGSLRPEEILEESRNAKPPRKRLRRQYKGQKI